MSEIQEIEERKIGYSWSYTLEIEKVFPVEGSRASAKQTEKYNLAGNTELYPTAVVELKKAKEDIGKVKT